jgi:hypothetical protein
MRDKPVCFIWIRSEVFAMIVCARDYKFGLNSCLFIIFLNKVIMFLLL